MIARNDPCPCGSGRKYKRCCLASGAFASDSRFDPATRFFGYTGSHPDLGPLELPKDGPVCMVFPVLAAEVKELRGRGLSDFRVGTWGVSTGAHENTIVHGPFESMEQAFEFGRLEVGVTEFFGVPNLDFL